MRRMTVWCAAAIVLASCGGESGSTRPNGTGPPVVSDSTEAAETLDAETELRRLVNGDDEVEAAWPGISLAAPADVSPAEDAGSTAAVVWIESYDDVLTLSSVSEVVECDESCVSEVTTWAEEQLASAPLPAVAGEAMCGNCSEASMLSFVTGDPDGGFAAVEKDAVRATIGEVDTPYEVMLSFGRSVRVRSDPDGWRAVDDQVLSDCDPFVTEYTMFSVIAYGEHEQLAQRETSDNSCA